MMVLLFLLFFSMIGHATEYQPWLGNFYEFELRSDCRYQHYNHVSAGSHLRKLHGDSVFLNLSLSNSLPDPDYGVELEITEACTRKQPGEIDQIKLAGRLLWLDDIAGDAVSMVTGVNYAQAFTSSLKDISSFHHGLYNGEFFITVGKETPYDSFWAQRWWGMFALGVAEQGSPWIRFNMYFDKRLAERHEGKIFIETLWGLGTKKLKVDYFSGYGPIAHQSIDIGVNYTYLIEFFGSASFKYGFRVYAQNFPAYSHQFLAEIKSTFGL